jgi:hypothetical protein
MSPNTRDVTGATPVQPGATPAPGQVVLQPGQPVIVLQQPAAAEAPAAPPPPDGHTPDALAPTHPTAEEVEHGRISHTEEKALEQQELRIYSHSNFLYWWPVWLTGYIMALLTWLHGEHVQIGNTSVLFHPSKNVGVIFTVTFFLIILSTTVTLRGLKSALVILGVAFLTLLFAYLGWWERLLTWADKLAIYNNMGFYVFFSTLVFLVWAFATFVYDRMEYWRVRPGQITYERVIGGAEKSYDTRGMVFEKHREDLFRHWILGLGSGDIQITTVGARRETVYVPNVLMVNAKIDAIQRMIAAKPTAFTAPPV